ncbi:uncharacterized protein LOC132194696 [Neocloeon triangulifer]|uniref:uncharacterized protein LOC132194696 n=1 Tax=Neocloeon triangulifer TaxID=2078957 RepID=UPI00286F82A2|nr:uncharacterized protein LOC132194696 [Neocloeon triangulifer]XP_059472122.1 uncharacterized protein LOC132194696 [Neocloeon triangulifer]
MAENMVEEAIARLDRMTNDVRPVLTMVNQALEVIVVVTENLVQQGYIGVESGLGRLLTFLTDSKILFEFGATVEQLILVLRLFLEGVRQAIKLYHMFTESELGKAIIKFFKELMSSQLPRYAAIGI